MQDTEKQFIEFAVGISDIQIFQDEKQMLQCEADDIELCYFSIRFDLTVSDIVNVNLRPGSVFFKNFVFTAAFHDRKVTVQYKNCKSAFKTGKAKNIQMFCSSLCGQTYFEKELGLELNEHEMLQSCITFRRCYRAQPFLSFSLCDL